MSLEQLVPSLAVSQQLKAAGFPQDTALTWAIPRESWAERIVPYVILDYKREEVCLKYSFCGAPTAEEILKELPVLIRIGENCAGLQSWASTSSDFSFYVGWQCNHPHGEKEDPWYGADKLSEAAAQAYLWWKK
jgi:hypothetical protein